MEQISTARFKKLKTDNGGFFPQHCEAIFHIRSEAQDISLRSNFTFAKRIFHCEAKRRIFHCAAISHYAVIFHFSQENNMAGRSHKAHHFPAIVKLVRLI